MPEPGLVVTLDGLDETISRLDDAQRKAIEPSIVALVTGLGLTAERAAREGMPKDTAEGARSINSTVHGFTATVTSPLVQVRVMDQGRRPGAPPPPPSALLPWMRRHGIPEAFAWVLARNIGRRGIQGRFFYRKAAQVIQNAMPGAIAKFKRDVEERF